MEFGELTNKSFTRVLGRDLNPDEYKDLQNMAQEHLNEYINECLVNNCGIYDKLKTWKKAEELLNRQLTTEERKYINQYIEDEMDSFPFDDTKLMKKIKKWPTTQPNQ